MFNMMSINPAYAGSKEVKDVTLLYRNQWTNYPGAPKTISFNFHSPFYFDKMGVGISFINDKLGIMNYNIANLAYAYHVRFKKSMLSFGLQSSFSQFSSNMSNIKLDPTGSAPVNDNSFNQNLTQTGIKLGGGIFFFGNKGYIGISSPRLADYTLGGTASGTVIPYKSQPHIFFAAGYVFDLGTNVKMKPSTLVKYTSGATVEADFNCNFYFYENLGLGISYRSFDSMDAIVEYRISKNLKAGYAFDYTLTHLSKYNSGSHELMLNWQFGFKKGKIITPRYF
jgi:type IX secretion system PorP/SprF family membrane protein